MGVAQIHRRHVNPAAAQSWRRWLVGLLLAALLAPVLAGMLPRPALSAEQGLERALQLSLCSTPGERDGDQDHGGQCQLCVLGCAVCCAVVADLPSNTVDDPRGSPRTIAIAWAEPVAPAPSGRPLQPRAPPASLI